MKIHEVNTFEEAMVLLVMGEVNRSYRESKIHEHSSRSHTIFSISLQGAASITLNLVDLAGSERLND